MEQLNERIRAMFDMMGNSIANNIISLFDGQQPQSQSSTSTQTNSLTSSQSCTSLRSSHSRLRIGRTKTHHHRRREPSSKRIKSKIHIQSDQKRGNEKIDCQLPFANGLGVHLSDGSRLTANRRYNCAVYYIHCVQHRKVAVTKPSRRQALWMPFMPLPSNQSWNDGGLAGLLIVLSNGNMDTFVALKNRPPFTERWIIEVSAIQLPQTMEIINRITWMVKLDANTSDGPFKCCQDSDSLIWVDETKLNAGTLDYIWGPEVIDFYRLHIHNREHLSPNSVRIKCNFVEYDLDSAFQFLPRNPPRTDEEDMLLSSNLSEKDIERLYSDFLDHCFPAMSMTFHSFRIYMTKYGFQFEDERLTNFFYAFNYNSNGSITFPELLMGLVCIDSHSLHNEVRAKFVMRYYDVHKRNYLTKDNIRQMLQVIHPNLSNEQIEERLKDTLKAMDIVHHKDHQQVKITYKEFVSAVGSHRFRGTSKLCRVDRSVFQMISNIIFGRRKKREGKDLKISDVIDCGYAGTCSNCKEKRPILEEHVLRINSFGYVCGRQRIKLKTTSKRSNSEHKRSSRSLKNAFQPELVTDLHDEAVNVSLNLIKMIHKFALKKGDSKNPNGLLSAMGQEREDFYEMLSIMEKRLKVLFECEQRCVSVSSPAFLIGDIHGNLDDLLSLEQCIWKRFPANDCNLVFLGDYVDRGRWSIECVSYLFALKILMPCKVTMLRGNHEVRPLQAHYSYRMECFAKYGDNLGQKIWDLTNRIFDRLPLCAIIDDSIFCAHGGIPRSTIDIGEIQRIETEIPEPEHGHSIAWEILWSDPIHQQQFLELSCLFNSADDQRDGFLPNRKRGTAYVFNEEACTRFLKHNGLTHMIRAHEVPTNGFFFHFDQKCTTIFSSSHYCGNNNECAVAFVDGDCIRIIRIDTTNNKSATD